MTSNRLDRRLAALLRRHVCAVAVVALAFGPTVVLNAWGANPRQPVRAAKAGAKPKPKADAKIKPQIPGANRYQPGKVFLENADSLTASEPTSTEYQVLHGNVRFRRGDMYMFCDSAYFYEKTSSLDAFGHVRMTQGDTLTVNAEILHYYGDQQYAELRRNVRLENRSTTLFTDSLDYNLTTDEGYYLYGGTIVDNRNNIELRSREGRYDMRTKDANFYTDVILINDKDNYQMRTNHLRYNMHTHQATITSETTIVSDSGTIVTSNGRYNTSINDATLYDRSLVRAKKGETLTGDTVYYNRNRNYGWARGDVEITDPNNKVILNGDYGEHHGETRYSYVTGHARAREYSQDDTLYVHADTLLTLIEYDSIRVVKALNYSRFYRSDLQGVCDSLIVSQADSILNLYHHAVLWNENRQISGEEINIHLNDSTADWATLPQRGLVVEHLGENYYDQLTGKSMKAFFADKELRRLEVDGNVTVIMYPQEDDSTYNKMVNAEASYLRLWLKPKQEIDKITMWPDVSGSVTPLYLAKRQQMFLPQFVWLDALRPRSPEELEPISEPLREYMNSTVSTK